nr:MAG TPA: hypothetical protein [Caudoviricetes sp.]
MHNNAEGSKSAINKFFDMRKRYTKKDYIFVS